ncbi:MAG: hypothetical protein LBI43_04695 [Streptococcaceae bacterium]|jgi:hypothetical protein|nr:hypothetical protein [Streptococcaceae bacterium]
MSYETNAPLNNSRYGLSIFLGLVLSLAILTVLEVLSAQFLRPFIERSDSYSYGSWNFFASPDTDMKYIGIFVVIISFWIGFSILIRRANRRHRIYKVKKALYSWMGKNSDNLLLSWGNPTRVTHFKNDQTKEMWEYRNSVTNTYTSGNVSGNANQFSRSGMYSYGSINTTSRTITTVYRKEFIIQAGKVIGYRYEID